MNFSIKKILIFILSVPFLLLILVIGFPFRVFSKLPPITQSVIHSPYSFCVETLSLIESKIDLIFNAMAALFTLISIFYIFHLIF
jgi:hypothetical protein